MIRLHKPSKYEAVVGKRKAKIVLGACPAVTPADADYGGKNRQRRSNKRKGRRVAGALPK
jgi:hypothetical protein